MNFKFNMDLAVSYKSTSQIIRVVSEDWVGRNVYCPICGNPHICNLANNMPVADLQCDNCGEIFELKSKKGSMGKKIADGAYSTMIERINSTSNPDLFVMNYSADYQVTSLYIVPKFFFTDNVIEKRKPLKDTARRAGWTGCNILFSDIPEQGRIEIITNQIIRDSATVTEQYARVKKLQTQNMECRGWLMDVLNCVNSIDSAEFSLREMYEFAEKLKVRHINNNNVEAKIRQQLQILRDKGFIEFLERGHYRKLDK